jgi:hypothetical protein
MSMYHPKQCERIWLISWLFDFSSGLTVQFFSRQVAVPISIHTWLDVSVMTNGATWTSKAWVSQFCLRWIWARLHRRATHASVPCESKCVTLASTSLVWRCLNLKGFTFTSANSANPSKSTQFYSVQTIEALRIPAPTFEQDFKDNLLNLLIQKIYVQNLQRYQKIKMIKTCFEMFRHVCGTSEGLAKLQARFLEFTRPFSTCVQSSKGSMSDSRDLWS